MTTHDPALQWAADRAAMPYDRFVAGLTAETIQRIRAAYLNRYVYSVPPASTEPERLDPHTEKDAAQKRINAAFQAKKHTLPREIRPEEYEALLENINVCSKPERHILEEVVKDEIRNANLAVTRAKLKHFLWWLGGRP